MAPARSDRKALESVLDSIKDKAAYTEATQRCPDLIERESNPDLFLQFEELPRAAIRLIQYWETRKRLFGESAFRSLFDLSQGAMSRNAIELIKCGVGAFLPPDDYGREVVFVDRSRAPPSLHDKLKLQDRQKACFFMMNHAMLFMREFVLIMLFRSSPRPKFIPAMSTGFMDMVETTFPLRIKGVHIVCLADRSASQSFMRAFFPVILRILNRFVNKVFRTLDIGEPEELKQKLSLQGIQGESLPECIGGGWSYDRFDDWFRQKVEKTAPRSSAQDPLELLATAATQITRSITASVALSSQGLEATLERLEITEKQHFLEALRAAPEIVKEEADPSFFVQLGGTGETAAHLVVNYWKLRAELFGSRALLPMKLTGEGALDRGDLDLLECGYVTLLPNDKMGHTVICCDPSRSAKPSEAECLRCFFYMLTVASKKAVNGVVILFVLNKLSYERLQNQFVLPKLLEAIPVKIKCLHVIRQPARLGERVFEEKVVPTIRLLFRSVAPIVAHSGTASSKLRDELSEYHFVKEDLPRSLGGGWTYEHFLEWREAQLRAETTVQQPPPRPTVEPVIPSFATNVSQPFRLGMEQNARPPVTLATLHSSLMLTPPPSIKVDPVFLRLSLQEQQRAAEIRALLGVSNTRAPVDDEQTLLMALSAYSNPELLSRILKSRGR